MIRAISKPELESYRHQYTGGGGGGGGGVRQHFYDMPSSYYRDIAKQWIPSDIAANLYKLMQLYYRPEPWESDKPMVRSGDSGGTGPGSGGGGFPSGGDPGGGGDPSIGGAGSFGATSVAAFGAGEAGTLAYQTHSADPDKIIKNTRSVDIKFE